MRIACSRAWLVGLLAPLLAGCGAGRGSVSGTVSFRNQALKSGTVLLFTEQGAIHSCLIDADGGYLLEDVPPGPARLAVVSHGDVPPGLQVRPPAAHPAYPGPAEPSSARKPLPIPEKYRDPAQSGLTLEVEAGAQTFDIVLRP